MLRLKCVGLFLLLASTAVAQKQDRKQLVQHDRQVFGGNKYWIYNDLDEGIVQAKKGDRPLLIVFR